MAREPLLELLGREPQRRGEARGLFQVTLELRSAEPTGFAEPEARVTRAEPDGTAEAAPSPARPGLGVTPVASDEEALPDVVTLAKGLGNGDWQS